MHARVCESATGEWILLRNLILPIRLVSAVVNTDDIKAVTKFLRRVVTDYCKVETCCDCTKVAVFRPGKLILSYSLFFMVVELWLSKEYSQTLKKNAQCNLGFACFFLEIVHMHI